MATTYKEIQLVGREDITQVKAMNFHITPNNHAAAYIKGVLGDLKDGITLPECGAKVCIMTKDTVGEFSTVLFHGIISDYKLNISDMGPELELWLSSATVLLDIDVQSSSFQNITASYRDVINAVLSRRENAGSVYHVGEDREIMNPLIQYNETDWEFIKRLVSHFETSLIPDVLTGNPQLCCGTGFDGNHLNLSLHEYERVVDKRFYSHGRLSNGLSKRDFTYYKITTGENYYIGDFYYIGGVKYKIFQKHGKLVKGELEFIYFMSCGNWGFVPKILNHMLIGAALFGTVLETKEELVKVSFDIDQYRMGADSLNPDNTITHFYKWTPKTGNLFYAMPEVGSRVAVCFGSSEEVSGQAVHTYHVNGDSCGKMGDFNNRYMCSVMDKELAILPDSLSLTSLQSGKPSLSLSDSSGISLSAQNITIHAQGNLSVNGETVKANVPQQVSMIRGSGSTFNMNHEFNSASGFISMKGTSRGKVIGKRKAGGDGIKNLDSLKTAAVGAVASIADPSILKGTVTDIDLKAGAIDELINRKTLMDMQCVTIAAVPQGSIESR